jgi:DNA-directed RNA polymerase specialized sigma subunit
MRYLDKLPWEEITDRIGCSPSHIYRLHQLALDILTPPPDVPD